MRKQLYSDYEVTEKGDVYSLKTYHRNRGLIKLRQHIGKDNRLSICVYDDGKKSTVHVSTLVAARYLPPQPSPKHVVRHLDGNPQNNHYTNLAWGTQQENIDDRERHGRTSRCEHRWNAKLTQDQVDRIIFLRGKVELGYWRQLAAALGVSPSTICAVLHNRNWTKRLPL